MYPKHVDEAVRRDEAAGATPKALANLQRIGALVIDFQAARANASAEVKIESVRCAGCGTSQPPSASGNCVKCGKALPRVTFSPLAGGKRRCGACGGAISYSDGQSTGAGGGGAGAIAGATGGYFIGFSGALTIMFGLMALGSVVALFSVRFRCDSCWEVWPARLLHGDERRAMAKQRLIYLVVAIGLGVLSAGFGIVWWLLAPRHIMLEAPHHRPGH